MIQVSTREVMNPEVLTVREEMSVRELGEFLTENEISGAPVVNASQALVGVVSLTDIVNNHSERPDILSGQRSRPEYYDQSWDDTRHYDEVPQIHIEREGQSVREIMNPAVYSVAADSFVSEVARKMVLSRVHRLIVIDGRGRMVGIVTALDLLQILASNAAET